MIAKGYYPGFVKLVFAGTVLVAGTLGNAATFVPEEINAASPDAGKIVDPEFSAAKGQFCWISEGLPNTTGDESLWLGQIDPQTGMFDPPSGEYTRVDFGSIVGVKSIGNGCEWVFSDNGAQIVYTKLSGGTTLKDRSVARALFADDNWIAGILQEAEATYAPIGSQDRGDSTPTIAYQGFVAPEVQGNNTRAIYVRYLNDAASEQIIPTTDEIFTPGARWVEGSNVAIFTRPMENPDERQVFTYDMETQVLEQLTFNDTVKHSASMWNAPEYGGEQIFLALEDEEYLGIYRKLDLDEDGTETWTRSHIVDPPANGTYIWSPEPFVANGKSYIIMTNSTSPDQASLTIPTEIWIAGIDPAEPFFRKISDDRELVRKDPETVVFPSDQPLVRSSSPEDFSLREDLSTAESAQFITVGSTDLAPAGGRNAVLVFALPALEPGVTIDQADFGIQVLSNTSPVSMAADLWALSISATLDPSLVFLEDDNDPSTSETLEKIADDLLTGAAAVGSRATLDEPQRESLADYLMAFYEDNPGYAGGFNLYLRLNPDMDGGTENEGWTVAASDHVSETGPTLTLSYTRTLDFVAAPQDYTLTEDPRIISGSGHLHVGTARGRTSGAGRNAIFAFDLPELSPDFTIERAALSFTLAGNRAFPGVNGDLWALSIQPTGDSLPESYLESDIDPESQHVKIADNLLTVSTPVNDRITLPVAESNTLGAYLRDFYELNPLYAGGETLYLRLNPDVSSGSGRTGWYIYPWESPIYLRPVVRMTVSSPDNVWAYISIGGEMHRLKTGL